MKIDLYTKVVLTVIAVALCVISVSRLPGARPAFAESVYLGHIHNNVAQINSRLDALSTGLCLNDKIC